MKLSPWILDVEHVLADVAVQILLMLAYEE
jgi:hypothetical protein